MEFTHPHKGCVVNQREVGQDTNSWDEALASTLRQAPDVILIGEIRHMETMEHAMAFAETGHLCLSTLHANNANQAMDRIINFFPEERHAQLLSDLSLNMRGIISQRLVKTVDGKRAAAIEILLGTPRAADLIAKGDVSSLKELMEKSGEQGMQTFDMALYKLYKKQSEMQTPRTTCACESILTKTQQPSERLNRLQPSNPLMISPLPGPHSKKNNQAGNQEVCLSFLWRTTTRQPFPVRELGNQQLVEARNNGQRIGRFASHKTYRPV